MFCGPPLAGLLVEITEDYYVSFVIAGVLIASGGVGLGFVVPFLDHPEHLRQLKLYEHGPPAPKAAAAVEEKAAGEGGEGAGQAGGEAGGEAGPSVLDVNGGPVGCYPATTRPAGYHRNATPAARAVPASVPPAPRSGKATIDGNYQLLYAREVHDDAR